MPKINIQKLIQSVSIDEVAKRLGMDLRKETSTQSKAICPFHDDKKPSLLIDASRDNGPQHFHCFACGAHGDVIDLVKEQLNLGFKEAVKWLDPGSTNSSVRTHSLVINQSRQLAPDNQSGLKLGYQLYKDGNDITKFEAWVSERQLDIVVLRRAGFLYASGNFLSRKLSAEKDASKRRERAGLLEDARLVRKLFPGVTATHQLPINAVDSAINQYSDFFIGSRIVFPLYDENKQLVGLGARSADGSVNSASPKYQYTFGFPKATVLYRSEYAFGHVRNKAKQGNKKLNLYLCEGFLDALRFEALGLPAVAIMGVSISTQQVRLLHSLSDGLPKEATLTVVVCFDRDEAGLRGAEDACLKLMNVPVECRFLWPKASQLEVVRVDPDKAKDPNDYLQNLSKETAVELIVSATYQPELAILANSFGVSAEDTLENDVWEKSPRSRRYRAFSRAFNLIKKVEAKSAIIDLRHSAIVDENIPVVSALKEWKSFIDDTKEEAHRSLSEEYLNDARARLNHARILAYMGARRGELPCDEPRWERLDVAATIFNALLIDRLGSANSEPIGSYDAVWVPRSFGGSEPRLKMMPRAEDLIIQQYLLNEILTERWDHSAVSETFSRMIPAVRYYKEERRTVTTGFDSKGNGRWGELNSRTLSFAYQINMDVLEGRQPATNQGMYRPFSDCWRDFMKSLSKQATDIGYVYSIRLDVKRYYDRLRRYVVRDRLLSRLQSAIESITGDTEEFAELLKFENSIQSGTNKAGTFLDRIDEQLFGVSYRRPDTGLEDKTDSLIGIPQGPVLSAWIGSIALFPVDEEAFRFMDRLNTDRERVGYARYVDDIVLLADSPSILMEMREAIDLCVRKLELTLIAKADEIPPMSAEDFSTYINQGRALSASGPAWEPPLVGDGESGWDFWSIAPTTDRQSALQLLHNVELYKASQLTLLQTVKTAFQAPDLRATELSKAARLIWYSIACELENNEFDDVAAVWDKYLQEWTGCMQGSSWRLQPEKNVWESPILFALEGLEHLLDTTSRDIAELSADENFIRRRRIVWLANLAIKLEFSDKTHDFKTHPKYQLEARLELVRWKALRISVQQNLPKDRLQAERSKLIQDWHPFEWMHEAVLLLSEVNDSENDPLVPFIDPTIVQINRGAMLGLAANVFKALLPRDKQPINMLNSEVDPQTLGVALQTLVSIVPKEQLFNCLTRRPHLIWGDESTEANNRLTLPPLPGVTTFRLYSCLVGITDDRGLVIANSIEAIEFGSLDSPTFLGSDGNQQSLNWHKRTVGDTDGMLQRLDAGLDAHEYLSLRERIHAIDNDFSTDVLKQAAILFRAIAKVVISYAKNNEDKELVPAWPYIASSANKQVHYLISDGVSRSELGNRAFVRDGGRALRTIEVPIYEASLWRVGVAISDYLGLYDDVVKFSGIELDVTLDAAALANPARYVLRTQLRKLRGAFANSQISKRQSDDNMLPATVERSLYLLESFPSEGNELSDALFYVLAAEAETAGMYLAYKERWEYIDIASFLKLLLGRVLDRLPLSIGEVLATNDLRDKGLRRDFAGLLCFARRLFSVKAEITDLPSWTVLCSAIVSTGISVAIDGLVTSMRSHGAFERYSNFDFPNDWEISATISFIDWQLKKETDEAEKVRHSYSRESLVDQLRRLVQHLGHRLHPTDTPQDPLSDGLIEQVRSLAQTLAVIENYDEDDDSLLDWPFAMLSNRSLELLNLELLENVAALVMQIDKEVGFEIVFVNGQSFGYNAQTRRFTDSRSGVREVTSWMISMFPRNAKHVEEISSDDRFLRVWSEVFDRKTGKLLSVSSLGEPFASIAVSKPNLGVIDESEPKVAQSNKTLQIKIESPTQIGQSITNDQFFANEITLVGSEKVAIEDNMHKNIGSQSTAVNAISSDSGLTSEQPLKNEPLKADSEEKIIQEANAFRKKQFDQWRRRGHESKPNGHVRVALLQANFDLTYNHPFVEACPSNWPFSLKTKAYLADKLKFDDTYGKLFQANKCSESGHHWVGSAGKEVHLPSWAEQRRRRILSRVIDSCEALDVDLLVLPEYSVRPETIKWLMTSIANKNLSILAGTYMNFQQEPDINRLTSPLTLLWPLPKEISSLLAAEPKGIGDSKHDVDFLRRGLVFEFSRNKKYRSIALEEFFRPPSGQLSPLFNTGSLVKDLINRLKFVPSTEVLSHLLTNTRLPLKHLLELICSEIFLVSSPANYHHMKEDLKALRRRFGEETADEEVFNDVKKLSKLLSITGNGIDARRSILAVPAATSRSADYWIAGQASFLSAGTTTVFCNSIDGDKLIGGSCFIGRGSWKSEEKEIGYVSKVTPYHGWSKGIYYNSAADALSKHDQAVVVVDIDPHNMLDGKPRSQTMPSPLQLVAYLPIIETVNWSYTEPNLLQALPLPNAPHNIASTEKVKRRAQDEDNFWKAVQNANNNLNESNLKALWEKFPDESELSSRATANTVNGYMQPTNYHEAKGLFATPAHYDWIDVSLTLTEQQSLPEIVVPPWGKPKA